ncbi:hypothetical protein FJT64_008663 [Amphibalanus amphitrite]|uniref:Uncharacterized protein n=1 Tax=Amphibalanus amphitrite TaxID=1232801 RepID=A0A6A4VKM2_AMPAM|nr:hypothetical protein FJT64_008663 [Amphibalanus amphitrite]
MRTISDVLPALVTRARGEFSGVLRNLAVFLVATDLWCGVTAQSDLSGLPAYCATINQSVATMSFFNNFIQNVSNTVSNLNLSPKRFPFGARQESAAGLQRTESAGGAAAAAAARGRGSPLQGAAAAPPVGSVGRTASLPAPCGPGTPKSPRSSQKKRRAKLLLATSTQKRDILYETSNSGHWAGRLTLDRSKHHPHLENTPGHDDLDRWGQTTVSQIRSGCSPLVRATLFRIGLATSSLCGQCSEEDTVVHLLCECLAAQEREPGSGGRSPPSRMCSRGRLNTSRSSSTEWGGPRHLWTSPGLPRPRARPAVRGRRRRRESRLTHRNRCIYPSPASERPVALLRRPGRRLHVPAGWRRTT